MSTATQAPKGSFAGQQAEASRQSEDHSEWMGLTDEHLEICVCDFVFLSVSGEKQFRRNHARTLEELAAECARRGRIEMIERAWTRYLKSN